MPWTIPNLVLHRGADVGSNETSTDTSPEVGSESLLNASVPQFGYDRVHVLEMEEVLLFGGVDMRSF